MVSNKIRAPMSLSRRAKQFQPFDALKGFREAIEATERFTEPRRELSEDGIEELNSLLTELQPGDMVEVEYYCEDEERYISLSGKVDKLDSVNATIEVANEILDWYNIFKIKSIPQKTS